MEYTYAVLDAGRQGTALAYGLVNWGEAKQVILADKEINTAPAI